MNTAIEKFLEFEYKNAMFKKEIGGIQYWHLIRFGVFDQILSNLYRLEEAHPKKKHSLKEIITLGLKVIKNLFQYNLFINTQEVDILFIYSTRKIKTAKGFYSPIIDTLIDEIENSYFIFEKAAGLQHLPYTEKRNIKYTDIIEIERMFKKIIYKNKIIDRNIEDINNWICKLENHFDIKLNYTKIYRDIENVIISYKVCKKRYSKLFSIYKPKIIVEVCHYEITAFIVNAIAKELGITTIELQHGAMGNNHIAYNFLDQKFESEYLPDYILTFGDFWSDTTKFPKKNERMLACGFPFYESEIVKYKNVISSDSILFLSQGTIGKYLEETACNLAKIIDKKYKIIFKLHPSEYSNWEQRYIHLKEYKNIVVIDNNDKSLYEYFAECKYLVGVYSTSIFESLTFNLSIFILKAPNFSDMEFLYLNGYASLVSDAKEIYNKILDQNMENITCEKKSEYFWKPNSKNNIMKEIKQIMYKNRG